MENKSIKDTRSNAVIAIVLIAVALIMVITYIVALSQFGDSSADDSASEKSITPQENVSKSIENYSSPDSEESYYSKLKLGKCAFLNEEVLVGNLAVITSIDSLPAIKEKDLLCIASTKEHDSYEAKDWTIFARKETISNMDKFLNAFCEVFPDNDLCVWNGYVGKDGVKEGEASIDLTTGYSYELATYSHGGSSQSFSDPEYSFLPDKAADYGVIQRYPAGKESYTGIQGNSKIYRYVGLAHSGYMNHYNYSLEEYIEKIKTEGVLEFNGYAEGDENSVYVVYYTEISKKTNTTYVYIPTSGEYEYSVSGDGKNGFIVTVKVK